MITLEKFEGMTTRQQFRAVHRLARVVAGAKNFSDDSLYKLATHRFNGQALNVRGFGVYGASVLKILNGQCSQVGQYKNNYMLKLSIARLGYKLSRGETFLGFGAKVHFNKYDFNKAK